ncbi:MAG: hypothetical protein DWQ37_21005 [Planctomycetota bacterium]|nr:MAG: hypothetical protein DWQ37_21005 [Planctomycetota bacterium]
MGELLFEFLLELILDAILAAVRLVLWLAIVVPMTLFGIVAERVRDAWRGDSIPQPRLAAETSRRGSIRAERQG